MKGHRVKQLWAVVCFGVIANGALACASNGYLLGQDGGPNADSGTDDSAIDTATRDATSVDAGGGVDAVAEDGSVSSSGTDSGSGTEAGSTGGAEAASDAKIQDSGCTGACAPPATFSYTGTSQTFAVPTGVTQVTVAAYGAQGGVSGAQEAGGAGASVTVALAVTPGEILAIFVGGEGGTATESGCATGVLCVPGPGGFNGGGAGGAAGSTSGLAGSGGGGASDVRQGGNALGTRVGGAGPTTSGFVSSGGWGGTATGGTGETSGRMLSGALGGTQTAGGTGGVSSDGDDPGGLAGALGQGGTGAAGIVFGTPPAGGGGGGGYYGGGGGGFGIGGGGGSSYAVPSATGVSMQHDVRAGNGQIVITY